MSGVAQPGVIGGQYDSPQCRVTVYGTKRPRQTWLEDPDRFIRTGDRSSSPASVRRFPSRPLGWPMPIALIDGYNDIGHRHVGAQIL